MEVRATKSFIKALKSSSFPSWTLKYGLMLTASESLLMGVIFPEMPGSTRQKKASPAKRRSLLGSRVMKTLVISGILGDAVVVRSQVCFAFC